MAKTKQHTELAAKPGSTDEKVEAKGVQFLQTPDATTDVEAQPSPLNLRDALEKLPFPESTGTCNVAIVVEFTREPGIKERVVHRASSGSLMVNAHDQRARHAVEHEIGTCLVSLSRVIDGLARVKKT